MHQPGAIRLSDDPAGVPGGQFVMVEWQHPGGETGPDRPIAPLHVHHEDDEAWYVIEGRLGFRVGHETVEAGPGECVFVERGTAHTYWNASPGATRYLLVMGQRIHMLIQELHGPDVGDADVAAVFRAHASELLDELKRPAGPGR